MISHVCHATSFRELSKGTYCFWMFIFSSYDSVCLFSTRRCKGEEKLDYFWSSLRLLEFSSPTSPEFRKKFQPKNSTRFGRVFHNSTFACRLEHSKNSSLFGRLDSNNFHCRSDRSIIITPVWTTAPISAKQTH